EATTSCSAKVIPMAGDWVDDFIQKYPAYAKAVIPAGMYPGNDDNVPTFGPKATVVSSARLRPEVVYQVVKAVFENFDDFHRLHPAFDPLKKAEMVRDGLTAPLH